MKKGFNLNYQKNWINSGHRMHRSTPPYVASFMEKLFLGIVIAAVVLYLCK